MTIRATSAEEANQAFRDEAEGDRYREVVGIAEDPIVSSDVIGDAHGALVDTSMTRVTDGDLVKVMAWYDNEWGYVRQMIRHALRMARTLQPA